MAIESPEGSDPRPENGAFSAALLRRLPRILLVTIVLLAATWLVLPFIPAADEPGPNVVVAEPAPPAPAAGLSAPAGLDAQLAQLQQSVTDADTKAANFKIANDLYTGSAGTSLIDQQVTEASNAIAAAEARRDAAQSHAALIRGLLDAGQPLDSVEDIRNSVAIQQLEQQKGQITAQRAQLLATFLPTHPGVVTATAQIAAIDKQIVVEARRVADALDAQATIESTGLGALQQNLDGLKSKQAAETRNAVALDALERDATASRAMLQSYLAHYGAGPASTSPDAQAANAEASDTAEIAPAVPSGAPAIRNTALILAVVGLLALAVQIGAVLILNMLPGRVPARLATPMPAEAEPYRYGEETGLEPDNMTVPVPAGAEADELAAAAPTTSQGLRRWFTRHAQAAEAPSPDEPMADDPMAPAEPVAESPAAEPEPEAAPALPAAAGEPEPNPSPALPADAGEAVMADPRGLANLSADLILGRASILVLASLGEPQDSEILAERLASDALDHGLSVAHVDAGSERPSTEPGITDLAADLAGFGDVVFKVQEGLAEIPWGHLASLDHDSNKPATLVEALAEVYEVVLVAAGAVDSENSLPLFGGLDSRLVLVGSATQARLDACRAEALRLGFRQVDVLAPPNWQAAVA